MSNIIGDGIEAWANKAGALVDQGNNGNIITARYRGNGVSATNSDWIPIYKDLGNSTIELSPTSMPNLAAALIQRAEVSLSPTWSASGSIYYYIFKPMDLWSIDPHRILSIGARQYGGSWRLLNFYEYSSSGHWCVFSNINTTETLNLIVTYY